MAVLCVSIGRVLARRSGTPEKLSGSDAMRFGEARDFPLADLLHLPDKAGDEADQEGMAFADGFCGWSAPVA